jgi:hypothetical protein
LGDGSGQPAGVDDSVAADAERGRDGAIAARESMLSLSPATRVFVADNRHSDVAVYNVPDYREIPYFAAVNFCTATFKLGAPATSTGNL